MSSILAKVSDFSDPIETKVFTKGRFELVNVNGRVVGRATYEPGWRWSVHVGPNVGETHCKVEHFGYVVSGACAASFEDGTVVELRQGELFYIPATPHDSWVIGDEPYVSLHLDHPEAYATKR